MYDFAARELYGLKDDPGIDRQELAQDIHLIKAQRIDKHEMDKAYIHTVFMEILDDIEKEMNRKTKVETNPGFDVGRLAREEIMKMPREEVTEEVIAKVVVEKMQAMNTINEKQTPIVVKLLTMFLKAKNFLAGKKK